MTAAAAPVVVWGNCQARPIAALLREPLAAHGLQVLDVPTVFEATAEQVAWVREQVARAAVLVTQPIRDEYRHPGCGSEQLAALVPASGRVVRVPSTIHTGWFPYQANAHDEHGVRIPAPLVAYHDLRLLAAAAAGRSVDDVLAGGLGRSADDDALRTAAADSVAELRRREQGADVAVSDLVDVPDAMFAMNHPANRTLGAIAERVLDHLGLDGEITLPEREFLGEIRTPVEQHVVAARGAGAVQPDWIVRREVVPWDDVVRAHLALYAEHPHVARDARIRWDERLAVLGF